MGRHILPVTSDHVSAATAVSQRDELLSGDALIVAMMQANALTHLASHDADFDRVLGFIRYSAV